MLISVIGSSLSEVAEKDLEKQRGELEAQVKALSKKYKALNLILTLT